jgi:hypothetical protein
MPYGDDISESLPFPLSNPEVASYQNSTEIYDIAINGLPFFLAINDQTPYRRVTAKYRKDQYDTTREPGEQSLTGWWLRSQSSFHMGAGIKFFEPLQDETLRFRFTESRGVDVWTQGQVTLLHDTYEVEPFTAPKIVGCVNDGKDALLAATGDTLYLTYADGSTGVTYADPTDETSILSLTTDGSRYFYMNTGHVVRGDIDSASAGTNIYDLTAMGGNLRFVKQRLIAAVGASLYELNPNATAGTALPSPFFTNPSSTWEWTAIAEGPQAIYVAGRNGVSSSIFKITLDLQNANSLGFPELNVPTVVVDLPDGEYVTAFDVYLGTYAVIVTNKGVRVGVTSDNGDIAYGPLVFEDPNCTAIAFRDRFAYVGTEIDGLAGLKRIDLSMPTSGSSFVFAWANDLVAPDALGKALSVAFYGESDKAAFGSTASLWAESDTDYVTNGYLRTGFIRYNMLDGKIFKYVFPRVDTTNGGLVIDSVDSREEEYTLVTYPQGGQTGEVNVTFPAGSQEYLAFKFVLTGGDDVEKTPVLTGYQVKSLPAIPRQRMIQYPVFCYDHESDALNNQVGYEGYAWQRLANLEDVESLGDTIRVQDFRTGESFIGLIEELDFINMTPTDKRFTGFGGLLLITVRSVS